MGVCPAGAGNRVSWAVGLATGTGVAGTNVAVGSDKGGEEVVDGGGVEVDVGKAGGTGPGPDGTSVFGISVGGGGVGTVCR